MMYDKNTDLRGRTVYLDCPAAHAEVVMGTPDGMMVVRKGKPFAERFGLHGQNPEMLAHMERDYLVSKVGREIERMKKAVEGMGVVHRERGHRGRAVDGLAEISSLPRPTIPTTLQMQVDLANARRQ